MKISEVFNSANINSEDLRRTPITITDRKGKQTKADGMPDVLPVILGIDLEYRSYQYIRDGQAHIKYGVGILPFITESGKIMQKYTREYVSVAQIAIGEAIGIDMNQLQDDKVDGFQLKTSDTRITYEVPEKVYAALEQAFPLGPVTREFLDENTECAEKLLSELWDKGDNYRAYISYLLVKGIGQFAATCQQIVAEQIVGPIYQILQMREQEEQQRTAMGKSAPAMTDLLGRKLSSKSTGKIVGLDGQELKADDVVN